MAGDVRHRLLLRRTLIDHEHARRPGTAAVHAAEPLHHALPGDQVADHVVRVEIDADLARRRRHHKDRCVRWTFAAREQTVSPQLVRGLLTFVHAAAADEQNDRRSTACQLASPAKLLRDALRDLAPVAVDQRANRSAHCLGLPLPEVPGPFGQHVLYRGVPVEILDRERLRRVEPPPNGFVLAILVIEGEQSPARRSRAQRRRQRQHSERGGKAGSGARTCELAGYRIGVVRRPDPPLRLDAPQKALERTRQVRLIQQHEGVAAHQSRLIRAHAPRDTVALEQQAGADHVDGADDDRRRRGIFEPFAVVDVLAAEGGDRQCPAREPQLAAYRPERRRLQPLPNLLGEIGGLVDHRAAVDDIDEPARQRGSGSSRQQPDRHDGGLAEARRNVHRRREIAGAHPREQPALPRKRRVSGQRLERLVEIERARHCFPYLRSGTL